MTRRMKIAAAGQVERTRKRKRRKAGPGEMLAADGGTLIACPGNLQHYPLSSRWLIPCTRCGMPVCRVCAEDQPHALPNGDVCELPPGVEPKVWGLEGGPLHVNNRFDKDDDGNFLCLTE